MKIIKGLDKGIKSEIKTDTWYHIVLSIAVIVKVIFVCSAIFCYTEERRNKTETDTFKRIVHIKDISNELTIIVICLLMLYVFNPFNDTFCVDKHFKTLLFVFAIFTLIEVHWVVFTAKVSPDANLIRFFFGRIGTMKQQTQRDREHAEYYDNISWN